MSNKKVKEKHLGIRIDEEIHRKLRYIADYEARSINGEILYLIKCAIAEFEKENGIIEN